MSEADKPGVVQQLEAVRAAMRSQPLEQGPRQEMEQALDALEQEFQVAEPADPTPLVELLRGWEAQLAAEHPVLARVVTDALNKLTSMGI